MGASVVLCCGLVLVLRRTALREGLLGLGRENEAARASGRVLCGDLQWSSYHAHHL